jgi:hypothetical protein
MYACGSSVHTDDHLLLCCMLCAGPAPSDTYEDEAGRIELQIAQQVQALQVAKQAASSQGRTADLTLSDALERRQQEEQRTAAASHAQSFAADMRQQEQAAGAAVVAAAAAEAAEAKLENELQDMVVLEAHAAAATSTLEGLATGHANMQQQQLLRMLHGHQENVHVRQQQATNNMAEEEEQQLLFVAMEGDGDSDSEDLEDLLGIGLD